MNGLVAGGAELVEQRHRLAWHIARPPQLAEKVHEPVVGRSQRTGARRDLLGQEFRELAQLNEGRVRVGPKIVVGLSRKSKQLLPVRPQEVEIGAVWLHSVP